MSVKAPYRRIVACKVATFAAASAVCSYRCDARIVSLRGAERLLRCPRNILSVAVRGGGRSIVQLEKI
jgi:hypothetical protein